MNEYIYKWKNKSPLLKHGNGHNSVNNYALTDSIEFDIDSENNSDFQIYSSKKQQSSSSSSSLSTITMPASEPGSIHGTNQIFIKISPKFALVL